jgi:hypothetical protein
VRPLPGGALVVWLYQLAALPTDKLGVRRAASRCLVFESLRLGDAEDPAVEFAVSRFGHERAIRLMSGITQCEMFAVKIKQT